MKKKTTIALAAVLIAGAAASVAQAQVRVILVSGADASQRYRIGNQLPENHVFVLRAGERLHLLSPTRGTIIIEGPGSGTLTQFVARAGAMPVHAVRRAGERG